jgi:hypothetical protein
MDLSNLVPGKEVLSNQYVRYAIVLFVGITIGVVFYPSKSIQETESKKYEQQIASLTETYKNELNHEQQKYDQLNGEFHSYHDTMESKVILLNTSVRNLSSKKRTTTVKVVHPDGLIETKTVSESDTEESDKVTAQLQQEYKEQLDSVEKKWQTIHESRIKEIQTQFDQKESTYKQTIQDLEKSKTITVNQKKFGVEIGLMSDKDYYLHASMDLWGPFFIGFQGEANREFSDNQVGAGIGLHF